MKVNEKNFRGFERYALVTGAASGMGRVYAQELARMGYNLIIVDINEPNLLKTADELRAMVSALDDWRAAGKSRFKVLPLVQDLSQMDAAEIIYEKTRANGCEVEVLINNAGLLLVNGICEIPEKKLSLIMMVHNYTPLMLCRKFIPGMRERHCGYVLNISSLAAWMSWPVIGMYGNTKRFVKDFSRELRIECKGTGVSVTNAYFGAVDTPLVPLKQSLRKLAHNLGFMIWPQQAVDSALKATFKRRKGTMPGFLNHIFTPLVIIAPDWFLVWAYKKCKPYLK